MKVSPRHGRNRQSVLREKRTRRKGHVYFSALLNNNNNPDLHTNSSETSPPLMEMPTTDNDHHVQIVSIKRGYFTNLFSVYINYSSFQNPQSQ